MIFDPYEKGMARYSKRDRSSDRGSKRGQNPKWVHSRVLSSKLEARKKPDFSGFFDGTSKDN